MCQKRPAYTAKVTYLCDKRDLLPRAYLWIFRLNFTTYREHRLVLDVCDTFVDEVRDKGAPGEGQLVKPRPSQAKSLGVCRLWARVYTCVRTRACTWAHATEYTRVHARSSRPHVPVLTGTRVHARARARALTHAHKCTHMHTHAHTCTHMHTHRQRKRPARFPTHPYTPRSLR